MKGTAPAKSMEPVLPFDLTLEGVRPGGLAKALHRQLRTAILERRLPAGYALPSTRQLASKLPADGSTAMNSDIRQCFGTKRFELNRLRYRTYDEAASHAKRLEH